MSDTDRMQTNLDAFFAATRHDLRQKMAILEMHNRCFEYTMVEMDQLTRKLDEPERRLYKQVRNYHADMVSLHRSLSFLCRTLENPLVLEQMETSSFTPYSKFLLLMRKQYDNQSLLERRGKRLCLCPPCYNDPELVADASMIERIISNLLDNAFKYAFDGTNIYLETFYETKTNSYVFRVTNFGAGIEVHLAEDIFRRNAKMENTTRGGFGLTIAQRYAEMHNGTLELECGIVGVNRPETELHFPELIVADKLRETVPDWQYPEGLAAEKTRLKAIGSDNPVAQAMGIESLYDEILSRDAKSYFETYKQAPAWFKVKRKPTYRVAFIARIPMQGETEGGA